MSRLDLKSKQMFLRKKRVRAKVIGTPSRPRLSVSVSNLHVSAQVIDDSKGKTLLSTSTVGMKKSDKLNLSQKASLAGEDIASKLKKAKIKQLAFDRNGRRYAGRLKAFIEPVRKEGIEV